jgi:hypothetical protein
MRRSVTMMILGFSMACGGSDGDFCQQNLSLLQSEDAKIKSCPQSANQQTAESAAAANVMTAQQGEANCETALKSCTSADMSLLSSFTSCEQSVLAEIQCTWYSEADPTSDPSIQKFVNDDQACVAKLSSLSSACQGT